MCLCFDSKHKKMEAELAALKNKLNPMSLTPAGEITLERMAVVIAEKLREMKDDKADIFFADAVCHRYKKADVQKLIELSETACITYVAEDMDCDNFAGVMYGEFCRQKAFPGGIVDSYRHRFNWFIDESDTLWFIEPQTRQMARDLENWQGWDVKFFLS